MMRDPCWSHSSPPPRAQPEPNPAGRSASEVLEHGNGLWQCPAVPADPLASYMRLQTTFAQDVKGEGNQKQIGEIFRACSRYLARLERFDLKSLVPGKQYFAFSNGKKLSRAVNI